MPRTLHRISFIDSHTGGEPTRVVLSGGPNLGAGTVAQQLAVFQKTHDTFRATVVNEPRGFDAVVGALLCQPADPTCEFGVIFFNNVGYLGMCGHGTIGLIATLAYTGRVSAGTVHIETPVGRVSATLESDGYVSIGNVKSRRTRKSVSVNVPGHGTICGDIAWGGNWFFLTKTNERLEIRNIEALTDHAWRIRDALKSEGITGAEGEEIDHIELFGPPADSRNHSRNFVLCPGKAYDRSPCGTGTSAKLACLYLDGDLKSGDVWRQESITGSVFEGTIQADGDGVFPLIRGNAFITAEGSLVLQSEDPFAQGIR